MKKLALRFRLKKRLVILSKVEVENWMMAMKMKVR